MKYRVNGKVIEYLASGEKEYGGDHTLLDFAKNLISEKSWEPNGFSIEPLFSFDQYSRFHQHTIELLKELWRQSGLELEDDFDISQYHRLVTSWERHLAIIEKTKLIQSDLFPSGVTALEERISQICERRLRVLNPFDNQSVFHFRIIRPQSFDNNPLHRDVWLEDYKDCINLYIPVAGSNELSSLILLPGSHHWSESIVERTKLGAVINGIKFNVPAVTHINRDFEVVRPSPKPNEVLVFSPYLIHGGAANLNLDTTRISLEVRLWEID